jgi:ATP-binding protein involved in chromosome partitioning
MVTTPQQVALQDALKGAEMFKKTNVPLLGFVLNMSSYICPSCGTRSEMSSGGKAQSTLSNYQNGSELLGDIPFEPEISSTSDEGTPIVMIKPQSQQVSLLTT